jgi:hypothetical protein
MALIFGFEFTNPAIELPELYVMTVNKLLGLFFCALIVLA